MSKLKFGKAFIRRKALLIDEISKVSSSRHQRFKEDTSWIDAVFYGTSPDANLSSWKVVVFIIVFLIIFSLLLIKIFTLQVVEGAQSRELADANRIKLKIIHAPRGVIFDRNGKVIAQNEPGFRLIGPDQKREYLNRDQALRMEIEADLRFPDLEIDNLRFYPMGQKSAHILGYLGEITEFELKDPKFQRYKLGDRIGRLGVEQVYEGVLKGVDGGDIIEVDAQGKSIRTIRQTPPIPGQNLHLTVDKDLQIFAYDVLEAAIKKSDGCCGALIAQDPQNGEILTLVSIPSFDTANLETSLSDSDSPFLNRVISGSYPPGSIYKIASALAGLSSGKISPQTQFEDTGIIHIGEFSFSNWYFSQYGKTEGWVDLTKALKRSNDSYFYRLGELIGEQTLGEVSKKLGLGKKLGVDLPGEVTGTIPDNNWKVSNFNEVWYPGDTLHMSIGQGFVLTTPIQMNNLISLVASNGNQFPPHLAKKITNQKGEVIREFKYEASNLDIKKEHFSEVKIGLEQVPKDGGTAWPFFNFPIPTAGKTGTAEFGDQKKTHAWYTSYAPADDPKIAVTVLIESGGEGSSVAAPVAKEIIRWFLSEDKKNLIKDIYPVASESARLGE